MNLQELKQLAESGSTITTDAAQTILRMIQLIKQLDNIIAMGNELNRLLDQNTRIMEELFCKEALHKDELALRFAALAALEKFEKGE